jgi:TatD DNase family protein
MIIDTHAHLFFDDIKKDITQVVDRALEQGVVKIIVPALDLKTSEEILKLSDEHEIVYAAIGLHPSDVKDADLNDVKRLEELTSHGKVVAIGEIGLDYYWEKDNATEQRSFFREQIELAKDKTLSIIIHTRNSIKDALQIINDAYDNRLKGQFHCFSGDENDMKEIIKLDDFYVSFCGNITFKNFKHKELIKNTPVDKLLSETDSPFLTPEPFRGKRNEPSKIVYTIKKIAEIKNINYDELNKALYKNAMQLFFKHDM